MRDRWMKTTLGEVAEKRTDFTAVVPDHEYVILGVQRSGWGFVEREPIKGSDQKFTKLMRLNEDDLVYRTITAFEAPSAVAGPEHAGRFVTPQTFPVFRIDASKLLPTYMSLLTTWPSFHEEMASRCTGTVLRRKTLSVRAFKSIPLTLPSLPEQHRIVDLIGAVDDAIASAEASLGASTHVFGAMADEYLNSADELVELDSVARVLRGAVWSKTDEVNSPTTEHEEVIGIAVTSATGLDLSKMKFVRGLGPKANRVEAGDLLVVGSNGNPQRIGNTYQTRELVGRAFSAFQMAVRPNTTAFSSAIYFALASPQAQAAMTARTAGSTGLKNLGVGGLRQVRIPDPSTEHASVWSDRLHAAQQVEMANRKALAAIRELRSNLLSALLSGEHEIPASHDELLEVNA